METIEGASSCSHLVPRPADTSNDWVDFSVDLRLVAKRIKSVTYKQKTKKTPWPLVRKRTIPTERPPLVD
jgi:hypothetical protein